MKTIKENLIDMFELDKLSPEKTAEMVERLSKLVFQSVLARVLPLLSEEDLTAYEKMVGSNDGGDKIILFLNEKIPDFEEIIKEESEDLKNELSEDLKAIE